MHARRGPLKSRAKILSAVAAVAALAACSGDSGRDRGPSDETADVEDAVAVRIASPAEGEQVEGPDVNVRLEVEGLTIVSAGVQQAGAGHHHLIVDAPLPDLAAPIPSEPGRYIHLGKGQTEFLLEGLAPGEHRVIALVGDHLHVPLDPPVADTVFFVVR